MSTDETGTSTSSAGTSGPFFTSAYAYEPSGAPSGTSSTRLWSCANGFWWFRNARPDAADEGVPRNGLLILEAFELMVPTFLFVRKTRPYSSGRREASPRLFVV